MATECIGAFIYPQGFWQHAATTTAAAATAATTATVPAKATTGATAATAANAKSHYCSVSAKWVLLCLTTISLFLIKCTSLTRPMGSLCMLIRTLLQINSSFKCNNRRRTWCPSRQTVCSMCRTQNYIPSVAYAPTNPPVVTQAGGAKGPRPGRPDNRIR